MDKCLQISAEHVDHVTHADKLRITDRLGCKMFGLMRLPDAVRSLQLFGSAVLPNLEDI